MWCKLIVKYFCTFFVPDWRVTGGHRLTCRWLLLPREVLHSAPQCSTAERLLFEIYSIQKFFPLAPPVGGDLLVDLPRQCSDAGITRLGGLKGILFLDKGHRLCRVVSEPPGLHPGTLTLPQSWQPVKEEINNKVNKVKVANCVNEDYEFPVE